MGLKTKLILQGVFKGPQGAHLWLHGLRSSVLSIAAVVFVPEHLGPLLHPVVVVGHVLVVSVTGSQTQGSKPFALLLEAPGKGWRLDVMSLFRELQDRTDSFFVFLQHMPLGNLFQGQGHLRHQDLL